MIKNTIPRSIVMEEPTTIIKLKDEDQLVVLTRILTADSPVFQHLLNELKYDEHEIDDFTPEAVYMFIYLLENRVLDDIEDNMFREIRKLATVFQVQ